MSSDALARNLVTEDGVKSGRLYTVEVTDPSKHLVHVTCRVWGSPQRTHFEYRAQSFDPAGPIPAIQNFKATLGGRQVPYEQDGYNFVASLHRPATVDAPLIVEYDCVLHQMHPGTEPRDQYEAYLGELFGIFRANYLFLEARDDVEVLGAQFILPEGWRAVTPWQVDRGWHVLRTPGDVNIDLAECVVGLGPFEVYERMVGRTRVTVAMVGDLETQETRPRFRDMGGYAPPQRAELPDYIFKLFRHYLQVVGDCPIPRYTVFFYPLTADGRWVNCNAWATGTAAEYKASPEWIAHEVFHWWNRVVPPPGVWLSEGWSWFFAWDGAVRAGAIQEDQWRKHLVHNYAGYVADLRDPEMRLPATTPDQRLTREEYGSLFPRRELLAYALNKELEAETDGAANLASVVSELYKRFGPEQGAWRGQPFTNLDAERALFAVGGAQARDFHRKHISGTDIADIPELAQYLSGL